MFEPQRISGWLVLEAAMVVVEENYSAQGYLVKLLEYGYIPYTIKHLQLCRSIVFGLLWLGVTNRDAGYSFARWRILL